MNTEAWELERKQEDLGYAMEQFADLLAALGEYRHFMSEAGQPLQPNQLYVVQTALAAIVPIVDDQQRADTLEEIRQACHG